MRTRQQRPRIPSNLNLQPGEKVITTAHRHWVVLMIREIPLLIVWLICSFVFLGRIPNFGMDGLNWFLFGLGSTVFLAMIYVYFDWYNDSLIVTTERVVEVDERLFFSVQRNELYNRDIQDVKMTTESVIERQFNYGRIDVETASRLRNIHFTGVASPGLVREAILRQVNPLKADTQVERRRQLVRAKVLKQGTAPSPPPPPQLVPEGMYGRGFLGIIPPSPTRRGDSIIWYKHWIFLFVEMANPVLLLLIVVIAWNLLRGGGFLAGSGAELLFVVLIVFILIWMVYELIDWRNDEYIITSVNVIDIDRKPLGREIKRETSWDRIEKISLEQPDLLSRWLNYGNIELATAGQQENFTFRGVGQPEDVLAIISDYREQFLQVTRDQEFDTILDLMRHYHELIELQRQAPPIVPGALPPTQKLP